MLPLINPPTLQDTIELVTQAHGQHNALDKTGKTPYIWHLFRVMLRLQTDDLELQQIALLHDVIEDTHITLKNLTDLGYSHRVTEAVKWASQNMFTLSFPNWMEAIGKNAPQDTVLLKIADIADNWGFERIQGLLSYHHSTKESINTAKKYYIGWNRMFENSQLIPLISQVYIDDFCLLSQLQKLSDYIPEKQYLHYLSFNNIHTWKIQGVLKIIQDIKGQDYVALEIQPQDCHWYTCFLQNKISQEYIDNKQKRDANSYHITILSVSEYQTLKKNNPLKLKAFLHQFQNTNHTFFTYGIGSAINSIHGSQAWYIVCENTELNEARNKLLLPVKDFHVTLAFHKKDVFNQSKNRKSVVFTNEVLWTHFVYQFNQQKNKKTYKFKLSN